MSKKLIILLKFISLIIVGFLAVVFIKNNAVEFKRIFDLNLWQFLILSALILMQLAISGYIFKSALEIFHVRLRPLEWFGLTVINRYSNYLLIKGGPVARGYYLKKVHKLRLRRFLVVISFLSFLQLGVIGLVSSLTLIVREFLGLSFNIYLFVFFLFLFLINLLPFLLPETLFNSLGKRFPRLTKAMAGWIKIRQELFLSLKLFLLVVLMILVYSLKIFIIYRIFFEPVPFSSTILITASGLLSFFVGLTPASIGIKELMMSYTAKLAGEGFASTAVVTALDRGITMVWIIGLGIIFSVWYSRKILKVKQGEKIHERKN